jgi:predicted ATPase
MVQSLFEEGALQRSGTVRLAKPISAIKVPATVQAVLASRIDRLPAPERELLQTLAVLGREFPFNLVQRVTGKSNDELERMLAQLEHGEFIFEQPAASDDLEYIFKHALTQEVAYNSLLGERRRALHDRAANAIEDLYDNQLESHYSDLAHHYLRATNAARATHYAADSLYEAVAQGLRAFQGAEWAGELGRGQTTITVVVKQPEVEHTVRVRDCEAWLKSAGRTPAEMSLKTRLRQMGPVEAVAVTTRERRDDEWGED